MSSTDQSKKISIELDAQTAQGLKSAAHNGLVSAGAYVPTGDGDSSNEDEPDLTSSSKPVKVEMDQETAKTVSQKLNDGLKAAGA
jgi:hypothetical protein